MALGLLLWSKHCRPLFSRHWSYLKRESLESTVGQAAKALKPPLPQQRLVPTAAWRAISRSDLRARVSLLLKTATMLFPRRRLGLRHSGVWGSGCPLRQVRQSHLQVQPLAVSGWSERASAVQPVEAHGGHSRARGTPKVSDVTKHIVFMSAAVELHWGRMVSSPVTAAAESDMKLPPPQVRTFAESELRMVRRSLCPGTRSSTLEVVRP